MHVSWEAMTAFSSSPPPPHPSCYSPFHRARVPSSPGIPAAACRPRRRAALPRRRPRSVAAAAYDGNDDAHGADSGGRLVDAGMIVLRKRLHDMQVAERNNCEPPSHWMEWEKRYYASYGADVCQFVGLLQALLMEMRPGVALGLLAVVALSVPTSAAVLVLALVGATKAALAGLHLG